MQTVTKAYKILRMLNQTLIALWLNWEIQENCVAFHKINKLERSIDRLLCL